MVVTIANSIPKIPAKRLENIKHLFYNRSMDAFCKLELMAGAMKYEPDGESRSLPVGMKAGHVSSGSLPQCMPEITDKHELDVKTEDLPIVKATMPGGKRITLPKTLQTTACERDCNYCCFRAGREYAPHNLISGRNGAGVHPVTRFRPRSKGCS